MLTASAPSGAGSRSEARGQRRPRASQPSAHGEARAEAMDDLPGEAASDLSRLRLSRVQARNRHPHESATAAAVAAGVEDAAQPETEPEAGEHERGGHR